jgi:gas vesicle protein
MKRSSLMFLIGTIVGAGTALVVATKKEEILKKLEELQTHLKESELPEKAKNIAKDVMESLKQLVISGRENLTEEERRSILDEVEEKIRKLEEAIEAEQTAQ